MTLKLFQWLGSLQTCHSRHNCCFCLLSLNFVSRSLKNCIWAERSECALNTTMAASLCSCYKWCRQNLSAVTSNNLMIASSDGDGEPALQLHRYSPQRGVIFFHTWEGLMKKICNNTFLASCLRNCSSWKMYAIKRINFSGVERSEQSDFIIKSKLVIKINQMEI